MKRAVQIKIQSRRETQYANDVATPCHIVIQCPVKKSNSPPACFFHALDQNRGMRYVAGKGGIGKRTWQGGKSVRSSEAESPRVIVDQMNGSG